MSKYSALEKRVLNPRTVRTQLELDFIRKKFILIILCIIFEIPRQ